MSDNSCKACFFVGDQRLTVVHRSAAVKPDRFYLQIIRQLPRSVRWQPKNQISPIGRCASKRAVRSTVSKLTVMRVYLRAVIIVAHRARDPIRLQFQIAASVRLSRFFLARIASRNGTHMACFVRHTLIRANNMLERRHYWVLCFFFGEPVTGY